ncbi:CPBP family intramembrane glutamic endopeptidase [cf. Phormidesmis sp. LEGE 11477]|uniref:CPBP family intramembrane glutamic endopeptidase n=1 Tax=cf. Phormidesmis sp. LEGE 11477 TaxID=1828680 RepID=UPI001881A45C|nr:CPBP family intramembrane glutamic endopeptidase [cf. Phormidesmis sp. LEGE 11477]MBE9060011.1 CPBP family intramembrane metalloprotease [cf. Phormidesmis sp. LEGE 11477]
MVASLSTVYYGLVISHRAIPLAEVLLLAAASTAIVTLPLASLGLWSRSKQRAEDLSLSELLVRDKWLSSVVLALSLGVMCGAFVVVSDKTFYDFLPVGVRDIELPGSFPGLLAAIGAGINEEIWFRLGVLTSLTALGSWSLKIENSSTALFWSANVVAAILFGAAHLPQFALMANGLSLNVIGVVLLQNGLVGLIFGWLYWRQGLLAAMLAHFTADIVIHVIVPTFFV